MKRILPLLLLLVCFTGLGASYYVDFDTGSDSANGTSTSSPWKHSKGDPNATGVAASATVGFGDTVTLKGGVVYRGGIGVQIGAKYFGTTAWGTGPAILDGTTIITTPWTQCVSAADAGGNPSFANIWWTPIPGGVSNCLPNLLMNGTNYCQWSQEPDPSDPIFWERLTEWRALHQNDTAMTWIHDPVNLIQTNGYYAETFAAYWVQGNSTVVVPITNYFQSSNTIWIANSTAEYNDRTNFYAVINHPQFIDTAGEWCVRNSQNRLYLWPPGGVNPNTQQLSISPPGNAFYGFSHDVTVSGFVGRGFYQAPDDIGYKGQFCVVGNSDWITHNIIVTSNETYFMKSFNGGPVIDIERGSNAVVAWNYIHDCIISRSIMLNGTRWGVVTNNTLYRMNGTGIYMTGSTNGIIANNSVLNVIGIHGNGISTYYDTNVMVYGNMVSNCTSLLTYEGSADLTFYNNVIDAGGNDYRINEWGGSFGPIRWFNNTLVRNPTGNMLNFVNTGPSYSMANNIISGGGIATNKSHNIYTALAFYQDAFYGWALGIGESVATPASVFVNPSINDWRPNGSGPATGGGTNLNAYFTKDYSGATRGTVWDIGAYEGAGSGAGATLAAKIGAGIHFSPTVPDTNPPPVVPSTNLWVKTFGGTASDSGLSVATDSSGNVFMGGYFDGTVNFGQGNVTTAGGEDMVIAKYNSSGNNVWVKTFGNTGSDRCNAIAVDSSGNVYAVGYFNISANMGGSNLVSAGGRDVFLAKYNNSGGHVWSQKFGSAGDEIAYAVSVDGSGNVYMSGFFQGTGNFGGTNISSAYGGLDSFVAKYSTDGVHAWSRRFSPNNSDDISYGLAADHSGGLIVSGIFQGIINLGSTNQPSTGGYNVYLVKLNASTGGWIWDRTFGGTIDDFAYTVTVDSADSVIVGGFFNNTANFGGGPVTSIGSADGYIAKYNSSGVYQWARQFAGATSDNVNKVACDASNNVLVTGSFNNTVNFGGGNLTSAGSLDGFLAKYSPSNGYISAQKFGGTSADVGNSVTVDPSGYALVTGSFFGAFTFATVPVSSAGQGDIFLWRVLP